jgi:hypothetical protein
LADVGNVSKEEAQYSLMMANLVCQLPGSQQKVLLAEILLCTSHAKDLRSIFKSTRPPTSQEDFTDFYYIKWTKFHT